MWFVLLFLVSENHEAFWEAARTGDLAVIKQLVDAGTPVDAPTKYGATALIYACDKGHLDVVTYLLDRGADINHKDSFYEATALSWALFAEHDEIVALLLARGADGADQVLSFGMRRGSLVLVKAALDAEKLTPAQLVAAKSQINNETPTEIRALLDAVPTEGMGEVHEVPDATLQLYAGAYHSVDLGMTVRFTAGDNLLNGAIDPDQPFTLRPKSNTAFDVVEQTGQVFEFQVDNEKVTGLVVTSGPRTYAFKTGEMPEAESPAVTAEPEAEPQPVLGAKRPWPMFRGVDADGIADGQGVPTRWNVKTGENIAWSTPVAGLANASPIIWGDQVFLVTAVSSANDQTFRPGLYGDVDSVEDVSEHSFRLMSLNLQSGTVAWDVELANRAPAVKRHLKSTQANSTPATDGTHVVALFGSIGLLACYDLEGHKKWHTDVGVMDSGWFYDKSYQWGHASSPIIYRDLVIIQVDIQGQSYVAAYRLSDGTQAWRTDRDEIPTWGTPNVVRGPRDELVTNGPKIRRYDAQTGELLWQLGPNSEVTVATPIYAHGLIYFTGGYPPARPVYAVRPGGTGDLSQIDDKKSEWLVWSKSKGGTYMPTPVAYRDTLYTVANDGRVSFYDAETGDETGRYRLGAGVSICASPIAADGRLFFTADSGDVIVTTTGPNMRELARNEMGEICMTTPAASSGMLVIRTLNHVYGIKQKINESASEQQEALQMK